MIIHDPVHHDRGDQTYCDSGRFELRWNGKSDLNEAFLVESVSIEQCNLFLVLDTVRLCAKNGMRH